MRCKVMKNQGSTILKYASTPANPIDIQVVRAFEQGVPQVFLPFTTMPVSPSSTEVHYDVTRMVTLSEHLRTLQGEESLRKVLGQMKQVIEACMNLRLPLKNLELEDNLVYYDSWADAVRFVYLPFDGIAPDVRKIRGFFEGIPGHIRNADAGMGQLLGSYVGFFAQSAAFNPVEFASYLGTIAGPTTQVDWVSVQANSAARKADSDTTNLNPENIDPARIRDKPASAAHVAQSSTGPQEKEAEQGAHARVDPGTTVLGALTFDFADSLDGTTVLDGLGETLPSEPDSGILPVVESEPEPAIEPEPEPEPEPELEPASASEPEPEPGQEPVSESASKSEPASTLEPAPKPESESTSSPAHERKPEPQYWLHRRSTDEKVRITGDRFVVGKSKYSTYQVRHTTTVSRSHAIFACDGDGCWIEDDGSRNGTFLDNRRIEPHEREKLEDGTVIRMSDEEFTFSVVRDGR